MISFLRRLLTKAVLKWTINEGSSVILFVARDADLDIDGFYNQQGANPNSPFSRTEFIIVPVNYLSSGSIAILEIK